MGLVNDGCAPSVIRAAIIATLFDEGVEGLSADCISVDQLLATDLTADGQVVEVFYKIGTPSEYSSLELAEHMAVVGSAQVQSKLRTAIAAHCMLTEGALGTARHIIRSMVGNLPG